MSEPFRYTLRVTNLGPSAVASTSVTDTLPAGLTFGSATPSQGTCSFDDALDRVSCDLGALQAGASATVSVLVTPTATGRLSNTASVSAPNDSDASNDTDTETTDVTEDVTGDPAATTATGTVTEDPDTGEITVQMFNGNRSDITITTAASCPDSETPDSVTLKLNAQSYPMTANGDGTYTATIPAAQVQSGDLLVVVDCPNLPEPVTNDIGQILLYDPSGNVTDATTGDPIRGATVTLFRVPGWTARTSPSDIGANTCESNLSKDADDPWSQPAPTSLGVEEDPASGLIDPALNPQTTNVVGRYGWDVAAGCWYVVVRAPGYETVTSPVVGVPPEVTDLDLDLSAISVALTRSAEKRVFGQSVTLNGTISATPACKADRSVQIQRDVLGGAVAFENYLAPLTSSATGTFSASFKSDRSADYRAVAAGTEDCGETVSPLTRVLVAVKVTLKSSKAKVPAGRTVTFTATVAPCEGHPGDKVDLYRGTKKIATKTLSSLCKATFKIKITKKATFQAKWKKQDDDHEAGASNKVTIRAI